MPLELRRINVLLLSVSLMPLLAVLSGCHQDSKAHGPTYGEVEADEIDVASRLPGRVKKILVTPGQKVKVGDALVEFEDDVMAAKKAGALATIAAAESRRDIAKDAVRPEEKEQLAAAVSAAKKQMEFAKTSLDRAKTLLAEGAIAQQAYDEINFKHQAATEQYNATAAKMKMANVGARPEERAGAEALVAQAKTLLSEVEAYEKDMILRSPVDGEVFQILNHEGELAPTGYPVMTLLKANSNWITLSVPENRLKEFTMDREVKVAIPALGENKVDGKVTYIAAMANFATKSFTQDRSSFDLKTFEIRITPVAKLEGARPGMTAMIEAL